MKTQQRNFVVEFKSGRRRSSLKQDAIWGGTDLKALAREAEAEAPHLFERSTVSATEDQDGVMSPDLEPATRCDDRIETLDDKKISASLAEMEQSYPPSQNDVSAVSPVSESKENPPEQGYPKAPRRRRDAGAVHRTKGAKGAAIMRSAAVQLEVPSDELVVLEEENRRLQGLLAEHLRQQNVQLRKMLERFGGIWGRNKSS
ncbi:hypothetical protein [Rhizobium sp. ICMP 5592]|uniref:hypothetical protein n=1 Tax=Rhizobium sp. ICMP 5592 TaxID=2292445 RepID=UPI0012949F51|nr:hypothetical protein [Rhizobium sp. ICMP 5592]MQB45855.1 hypothetical protein [Rhizobium sp. ICMP 5592]